MSEKDHDKPRKARPDDEVQRSEAEVPGDQAEEIQRQADDPDQGEDLGPAAELMKAAQVEAAAEVTQDEDLQEEAGPEAEGIEAAQLAGIALAVIAVLVMLLVVIFFYADFARQSTERGFAAEARYPRLEEQRLRAQQQLHQYGVVDQERGVYHIPIDRAIDLVADEAWEVGRRPAEAQAVDTAGVPAQRGD